MAAAGAGLARAVGVTRADRMLSYLPMAHVMERAGCELVSLMSGMPLFFADSPETFLDDLKRAQPTIFISVPRLWQKLRHGVEHRLRPLRPLRLERIVRMPLLGGWVAKRVLAGLGLGQVRFAVSASASLSEDVIRWYRSLGLELQEAYGMTENFAYSHISQPGQGRVGYVGHPRDGVSCRLGPAGEVLVKSPASMLGYFKDPELTRDAFTDDGYLKTGDRGELDAEGRLRLTGRLKDIFKTSNGKYVVPGPIEDLLNADTAIEASCVLGSGQRAPCALVTLAVGPDASAASVARQLESLRVKVNAQLDKEQRLELIVASRRSWSIEAGELTPSLKVCRGVIEAAARPHLASWYGRGASVIIDQDAASTPGAPR
jgi:long-subunit acyl-CoA synthetase (AMP-forming)